VFYCGEKGDIIRLRMMCMIIDSMLISIYWPESLRQASLRRQALLKQSGDCARGRRSA
jgi:hypothetical protein